MDQPAPFPHYTEWLDLAGEAVELFGLRRRAAMVGAWRQGYLDAADELLSDEFQLQPSGGNYSAPLKRLYRKGFVQRRSEIDSAKRSGSASRARRPGMP